MQVPGTIGRGNYFYDPDGQALYFDAGDAGITVIHSYTFFPQYLVTTELYLLQAGGLTITVQHSGEQQITKPGGGTSNSVIYTQDLGVVYYPGGAALSGTNSTSAPTASGTYTWYRDANGNGIYQFYSGDEGKQIVIRYSYLNPDYDTNAAAQAGTGGMQIDFNQGLSGQSAPAWLTSRHPDQALGYTDTAIAFQEDGYLGMSGALPDYTYEVMGIGIVGAGTVDADPVSTLQTLLTDPNIGINFPSSAIDQASWFTNAGSADNWINANQFYVSHAITNPTPIAQLAGAWLEAFNLRGVYSEGLLKLIPLGDQSASAASPVPATYTPSLTIRANLGDTDYLEAGGKDPVTVTRASWADAYNRVQVGYRNRDNGYNTDLIYEQDEGAVARYGLRIEGQRSLDFIATWQLAAAVANMRLKRYQTVRNTYQFSLPITFEYLEPMDLVSLTDSRLGLAAQTVRITKVTNDPGKGLAVEAEDFPGNGYAMPLTNPKQATPRLHPHLETSVAGKTEVVIVQAQNSSASSQTSGRIYIWVRGKDSGTWGSADIWRSLDGTNWEQMAVAVPAAEVYTLTSALPSVATNPQGALGLTHDTSSTLTVQPATSGNVVPVTAGVSEWSPDTNYAAGQFATYDGYLWAAQAPTQGNVPTDGDTRWLRMSPVTANIGAPPGVTDTAASQLQNLVAVVGSASLEFLSYANVAAGSAVNSYNLTDLYRGALGTIPQAAPSGAVMVAFDGASAQWDIPAGLSGSTVYFRVVARNIMGGVRQGLEDVQTISFVVPAAGSDAAWDNLGGPVGEVISSSGKILITAQVNDANNSTVGSVVLGAVTGWQQNLVPDSDMKFPSQYWPTGNGISIGASGGFGSGQTLVLDCNADVIKFCPTYFPVTPGQQITLSANFGANGMTAGYALVGLDWPGRGSTIYELDVNFGAADSRQQKTFTVPAGVAQMRIYYGQWALSGAPAGTAYINQIQVELGSVMTAYKSNALDTTTGGLPVNLQVQEPGGALSPVVLGDQHKRSRTALDVNGYLVTGTPTTPTASLDTGASRANTAIDAGNIVVPAGIDLARAYTNKHLGNIPDDPASGRLARRSAYIAPGGSATWVLLGTWTFPADGGGYTLRVEGLGGQGFNSLNNQQAKIDIIVRSGDGGVDNVAPNISGATWIGHGNSGFVSSVKVASHGGSTAPTQNQWDIYVAVNVWSSAHWDFYCDSKSSFATSGTNTTDPGPASSTVVVATGQTVLDTAGNIYPAVGLNGKALPLGGIHDRVNSGFDGSGRLLTGTVATPVAQIDDGIVRSRAGLDTGGHVVVGTVATPVATIDDGVARSRTGLDTSGRVAVGTAATPVAQIDSAASRANAAIDSGNVVVAASIDLARGYTNQNLDHMPDGSGRILLKNVNADGSLHASTALNPQGNILPTQGVAFSITSAAWTGTAYPLTISWSATTLNRPDGSTISVAAGSAGPYNASASTTYIYYPRINTTGTPAVDIQTSPAAGGNATKAQNMFVDGYMPAVGDPSAPFVSITTPAAGGSPPSGGGGGGTCPADDQIMEARPWWWPEKFGWWRVKAKRIKRGWRVRDWDGGSNIVRAAWSVSGMLHDVTLVGMRDEPGETYCVDLDHLWGAVPNPNGHTADHWKASRDLVPRDVLWSIAGPMRVAAVSPGCVGRYRKIKCDRQRMRLGRAIGHNYSTS